MRRREFISFIGGAAVGLPVAARGQQTATPLIGFLGTTTSNEWAAMVDAFRAGLAETGYREGRNVAIEFRWADGRYERLPDLAADLVSRRVALIIASGGNPSALAAKAATNSIPIVFASGADPVAAGLVVSLNRPGGNVTGITFFNSLLAAKRLQILHELVPTTRPLGFLINSSGSTRDAQTREMNAAARTVGRQLLVLGVSSEVEFATAFATFAERGIGGVLLSADPFFLSRRDQIIPFVARYRLPAIYNVREWPMAGGLMSYGTSITSAHRQVGAYAGRILKGEKPADLPIQQSVYFELVINLATAKLLRLEIPPKLLALADEVIE